MVKLCMQTFDWWNMESKLRLESIYRAFSSITDGEITARNFIFLFLKKNSTTWFHIFRLSSGIFWKPTCQYFKTGRGRFLSKLISTRSVRNFMRHTHETAEKQKPLRAFSPQNTRRRSPELSLRWHPAGTRRLRTGRGAVPSAAPVRWHGRGAGPALPRVTHTRSRTHTHS